MNSKENMLKILGQNLDQQRKLLNLKQSEMAEKIDSTDEFISLLVNGKTGIGLEKLINLFDIGFNPNITFKNIVTNFNVSLDIEISSEISKLSDKQKLLLLDIIKLITK